MADTAADSYVVQGLFRREEPPISPGPRLHRAARRYSFDLPEVVREAILRPLRQPES